MTKWQLLVGGCSLALVAWGMAAFVEYSRAVGATGDAWAGWIYSGLGLCGLLTLLVPRLGYLTSPVQLAAALYGLWWCVVAGSLSRAASILPIMHLVAPLILMIALGVVLLCGANAVGTWQIARLARR